MIVTIYRIQKGKRENTIRKDALRPTAISIGRQVQFSAIEADIVAGPSK